MFRSSPQRLHTAGARPQLPEEIYYHSFLNRDRVVHVVDPDLTTCEALLALMDGA